VSLRFSYAAWDPSWHVRRCQRRHHWFGSSTAGSGHNGESTDERMGRGRLSGLERLYMYLLRRVSDGLGLIGAWTYQVRLRHVASLGRHSERIREWISGGKRGNGVNILWLAIGRFTNGNDGFRAGSTGTGSNIFAMLSSQGMLLSIYIDN
jgi:hypothetical protein